MNGGETGIRTLGTIASTTVFETAPFNHSGTSPRGGGNIVERFGRRNNVQRWLPNDKPR